MSCALSHKNEIKQEDNSFQDSYVQIERHIMLSDQDILKMKMEFTAAKIVTTTVINLV